jgi:hypothetical protein
MGIGCDRNDNMMGIGPRMGAKKNFREGVLDATVFRCLAGCEVAHFPAANAKRPAHVSTRAAGGTVGIDQEVVTLRGLFGNSGSRLDLQPGGSQP